jgi:hypothetical protein
MKDVSHNEVATNVLKKYLDDLVEGNPFKEYPYNAREFTRRIQQAIDDKANLNIKADALTTLMLAAYYGNCDALIRLLATGVTVKETDHYGRTALQIAKAMGFTKAASILEDFGAGTRYSDSNLYRLISYEIDSEVLHRILVRVATLDEKTRQVVKPVAGLSAKQQAAATNNLPLGKTPPAIHMKIHITESFQWTATASTLVSARTTTSRGPSRLSESFMFTLPSPTDYTEGFRVRESVSPDDDSVISMLTARSK